MNNPFAVVSLTAKDLPWYERLRHLHPELNLSTRRRESRNLEQAEALVMETKGVTRAEAYDLHPEFLDVLRESPDSLPDGFATADGDFMLWSLALVRYWFDKPLLIKAGAERMTVVILHVLLKTGYEPSKVGFQLELETTMDRWYSRSAAHVAAFRPADIDPLTFCAYTKVCGAHRAAEAIRANIPLEYAGAL